jgi:hypothetical protein
MNLKVATMKTKITVLYYLRKSKVNLQAQMPIYQRITINGQRFDVSTGLFVEVQKWYSEASKMKATPKKLACLMVGLTL